MMIVMVCLMIVVGFVVVVCVDKILVDGGFFGVLCVVVEVV